MTRPLCTAVLPLHDRVSLTQRWLIDLLQLGERLPLEIIVVDCGCTDLTPSLLDAAGDAVRTLHAGGASAVAALALAIEAAAPAGEFITLLDQALMAEVDWLTPLVRAADHAPRAAAIGRVIVGPDDRVEATGFVFDEAGQPRHLYRGFPADHPAITRPRAVQALPLTGALIRRAALAQVGPPDAAYASLDLASADWSLRAGAADWTCQLAPASPFTRLVGAPAALPATDSADMVRFRAAWSGRVATDDLDHYLADGLIAVDYSLPYPLRLSVSPLLAVPDADRARQVREALRGAG